MFKKPNRKFKSRQKDDIIDLSGDLEEDIIEIDVEPCDKFINRSKPAKTNPTSILSFDHEEGEEETFKIKRPNHSKRIAKQLKRERDEEKFIKKKNVSNNKDMSPLPDAYRNPQEIKLKPVVVKEKGKYDKEFKQFNDSDEEVAEEELSAPVNPFSGIIPDAITINEIRRKRQLMARGSSNKDDYIKLNSRKESKGSTSRLVREEDHDKSDEDEDILGTTINSGNGKHKGGVSFTTNSREYVLRDIQRKIIAAEEESGDSDHDNAWEHQQIKKATGKKMGNMNQEFGVSGHGSPFMNNEKSSLKKPFNAMLEQYENVTIPEIISKLTTRFNEMKEAHSDTVNSRNDITSRLEQLSLNMQNDDGSTKHILEKKYRFFQETRSYFTDLIACLNAKLPAILCIERGFVSIESVKATRILTRSRLDLKEESAMHSSKPPDLDKEEAEKRQQRCAEREGRRSRRRRYRVDKGENEEHEDGTSTDDEVSRSQQVKFHTEKERLNMEKSRVFEDVAEDFSHPKRVIVHFTKWRDNHTVSYSDAYITLCLPKLMVPFARFECLDWNPLKNDLSEIEAHVWYQALLYYHRSASLNIDTPPRLEEFNVIPTVIEKVIIPKITNFIEKVWSPASTKQTSQLGKVIMDLRDEYPNVGIKNKNTQLMMKALVTRLKSTLDEDIYIPLMNTQMIENKKLATSTYFYRQFWSCFKIYCNILLLKEVLSPSILKQLAVESLFCRYMVMALSTIGQCNHPVVVVSHLETIIGLIPMSWYRDESLGLDSSFRQLHFVLEQLAASAYSRIIAANDESHRTVRELIRRILSILKIIRATDSFKKVCEKYSIRLK